MKRMKRLALLLALSSTAVPLFGETRDLLSESPKTVLAGFEKPAELEGLTRSGDLIETTINPDPAMIKAGRGSLRLLADNEADGKPDGHPAFTLSLEKPVDLSDYRGLSFWLYVPEGVAEQFFGRKDVTVTMNAFDSKNHPPIGLVKTPEQVRRIFGSEGGPLRALSPGWTYYYWDFSELNGLPVLSNVTFMFGQIMAGYSSIELYLDEISLHSAAPMQATGVEQLALIVQNDADWTRRFKALQKLGETGCPESMKAQLNALADESTLVKQLAIQSASVTAEALGADAHDVLREMFDSEEHVIREAILRIVAGYGEEGRDLVDRMLDQALYDDVYYVRHLAYETLLERGESIEGITAGMLDKLAKARSDEERIRCVRTIDMIGPQAHSATEPLLAVLRNTDHSFELRAWALKALWWLQEEVLSPEDWALGLALEPGQIHRHLLDRVCDHLEQAGPAAVPVLREKLHSTNPQVRARAAAILGNMGEEAASAVGALETLSGDSKWYVAHEAKTAVEKITGKKSAASFRPQDPGEASDVSFKEDGDYTLVTNGLVELVFKKDDQSPGPVIVREPGGENIVDGHWLDSILAFKYSKGPNFREKQWLQRLWGSRFPKEVTTEVARSSNESVDFVYRFADEESPFVFEFHYVVKKGLKGFYGYIVAKNVSNEEMPESHITNKGEGLGRFNYLIALTWGHYDYVYIHDKLKGPARQYHTPAIFQEIPEIANATIRLPDGQIWAKHEWERYELESPVTGYCGENGGVWMIVPDLDFYFDAYPRWTKGGYYDHLFIPHLESKYSAGSLSSYVDADFEKIYGPMLFYINNGENPEEMWTDAKRQAQAEMDQWPYTWLDAPHYHDRGAVTGTLSIKGQETAEGTYVILGSIAHDVVKDEGAEMLWMYSKSPYNYYTQVKADGSFEIPNVHAGKYDISAYAPGILGADVTFKPIEVVQGETLDTGTLILEPHDKGEVIWQIGIPDGGSMEFKNGRNFHNWDNYDRYAMDFPEGVDYTVGKSDWKKDWNYLQPAVTREVWKPHTNTIRFDLKKIPEGDVVLMSSIAGRSPVVDVILNGHKLATWKVDLGGQLFRTAPYGKVGAREVVVPKEVLETGNNVLQFTFARGLADNPDAAEKPMKRWTSQIMYDYIRLEERP